MIAVVEIGGKQYKVAPKTQVQVDLLEAAVGDQIEIDKVLLTSDEDGKNCSIGQPYTGTTVKAKIVEHVQGEKVRVFKMTAKKRYAKTIGHRQKYTVIEISDF